MYVHTKTLQILHHGVIHFTEVSFYFFKMFGEGLRAFALVLLYSLPNEYLLWTMSDTLAVCRYQGDGVLTVIDVKLVLSVMAMVPFPFLIDGHSDQYFMIEKVGLDVIEVDALEDNK